jgi:hypothetical protein
MRERSVTHHLSWMETMMGYALLTHLQHRPSPAAEASVLPPKFVVLHDGVGDKPATENKGRVFRFQPHFTPTNFGIGTLEY